MRIRGLISEPGKPEKNHTSGSEREKVNIRINGILWEIYQIQFSVSVLRTNTH